MTNQLIAKKAESANIDALVVTSNKDSGKKVDLAKIGAVTDLYYYESVLQETIRVTMYYVDTGGSVEDKGKKKTVLDGLPLVGEENVSLKMTDNNDNQLSITLYVNKVTPVSQDGRKGSVTLDLVSKEYILNEQTRLNIRFDGKISDHISKILTDQKFLATQKSIDIESTENNYNFIGNNRKPFYACTWLSKKAIPNIANSKGNTAGYFFYETADGFKFKSVDNLLSQSPKKKLIENESPDGRGADIPKGYDGKILEKVDDNTIDVKAKREIGAYSTRVVLFDPFNCVYEIVKPRSEEIEKNLKLAGKELPVFNKEFDSGRTDNFTRTTYTLIDKGSLPSGSTDQQIQKSKEQNFDPKNILNQSTMRYNQLFTVRKTITIPGDFSLHAGDIIQMDYPEVTDDKTKEVNKDSGGIYMIADLCHYITANVCLTKLNLVRDSYGRKGSINIPL